MDIYADALREAEQRFAAGWRPQRLLGRENLKLKKGAKYGWRGMGLSLAPARISGYETCASRSQICTDNCIFTSGRGIFHKVMMGRIFRTLWFYRDRASFMDKLMGEIQRNQSAAIRLNVFSDLMWERQFPEIMGDFPQTQFYDYTKHARRMFHHRPKNYHLTFSLNERNEQHAKEVLDAGMNVAAVVRDSDGFLFGYPVINGDDHDLRFLDPAPTVVGLAPKGELKKGGGTEMIYDPDYPVADAA